MPTHEMGVVDCSKRRKGICEKKCHHCLPRSFAGHEKAKFWHSEKNLLEPYQVALHSNKKFWFICGDCGHDIEMKATDVAKNSWCLYCANKKLCEKRSCAPCFVKSFASHPQSRYWSLDNFPLTPRDVCKGTEKKYWFICDDCPHSFLLAPSDINKYKGDKKSANCPFCFQHSLYDDEDCDWCFDHSFASHEKAECWSLENFPVTPRRVRKFCNGKFYFDCWDCGSVFRGELHQVARGRWCPNCKHKTERKVFLFLKKHYPTTIPQFSPEWCRSEKSGMKLRFDFCVGETIIEVDGPQHFVQVSSWEAPEKVQERDRFKEQKAEENGYRVIRFHQLDIWKNKIDWENMLLEELG